LAIEGRQLNRTRLEEVRKLSRNRLKRSYEVKWNKA
jgi:hypothetical protein